MDKERLYEIVAPSGMVDPSTSDDELITALNFSARLDAKAGHYPGDPTEPSEETIALEREIARRKIKIVPAR